MRMIELVANFSFAWEDGGVCPSQLKLNSNRIVLVPNLTICKTLSIVGTHYPKFGQNNADNLTLLKYSLGSIDGLRISFL